MSAKAWAVGGALAVIIALLALPLLLPTKWEYRIVAIPDPVFTQAMNIGGAQGWEAILARRAVDSDSDEASYEVIFKRPRQTRGTHGGRDRGGCFGGPPNRRAGRLRAYAAQPR